MPTPSTPRDTLFTGKSTIVNPSKLTQPHANNYGQAVNTGALKTGQGFPAAGPGSPMGATAPARRWVKIGHLSQGQGGAQKATPNILGPRPGFR
jgi:hypothetical protein